MDKFNKKNMKGFTLVELLVVITIIGIITVLALPSVRQLQARNRNKKFEKYSESLKSSGKLYTDSYSIDMFGNSNGCVDIKYSELKGKSLIKDYEVDGISCDSPDTFVQVIRESGKYKYNVSLHCTKDGSVRYSKIIPKCDASATGSREPKITVDYVDTKGSNGWSQTKKITIKATAPDGLNYPSDIQWGFSKTAGVRPETLKTARFGSTSNPNESVITLDIADMNGIYYLFIDGVNVRDKGGKFAADYWSEELKFDNDVPNITNLSNPKDNTWVGTAGVNDNSYVINVDAADPMSGISYYQYSYPNSTIAKEKEWTTYEKSQGNHFTTTPFKSERNEYVEIRACDYANNCSAPVKSMIKIDKTNPTCNVAHSGTTGENRWYKEKDVSLSLTRNDNGGSGVNSFDLSTSKTATYTGRSSATQGNTSDIIYYGYVKDNAGNVGKCESTSFKVDKTPPSCRIDLSGTGSGGTYTSKVNLSLVTSDSGNSGVSQFGMRAGNSSVSYNSTKSAVQDATAGVTWYGFVKDAAGNTATCNTGNFKVSLKPPVITFSLSGQTSTATCKDGNTGAYITSGTKWISNGDLTHSFSCTNSSGQKTSNSRTYSATWHCTSTGKVCDTCHGSNCGGCCGTGGKPCSYPCNCHDECNGGYYSYS